MDLDAIPADAGIRLRRQVKIGLIRELYRQKQITQSQFEQLMRLQRG